MTKGSADLFYKNNPHSTFQGLTDKDFIPVEETKKDKILEGIFVLLLIITFPITLFIVLPILFIVWGIKEHPYISIVVFSESFLLGFIYGLYSVSNV